MYKLYSTELYRFTFVLNAWPVDERARSQPIHYIDLPVVILTPQITLPPFWRRYFWRWCRHSLDSLTNDRREMSIWILSPAFRSACKTAYPYGHDFLVGCATPPHRCLCGHSVRRQTIYRVTTFD